MKKLVKISIIAGALAISSCDSFLEVEPIDKISADKVWRTREDAVKNLNGPYAILLDRFLASTLYNNGDFRSGNWEPFEKYNIEALGENDLWSPDLGGDNTLHGRNWVPFYQAIEAANLCIDRIPGIEDPAFSTADKNQMVAEARFIRAFTYFFMVRMYGDVPLNNDPYNTDYIPRTNMVEVLQTCLDDLGPAVADLPVVHQDPTNKAVRASQGAALTLMAEINMWLAGFDKGNRQTYWQQAADLAGQVMDLGIYRLLPYTPSTFLEVFKGRSDEGIFELSVDINYGAQTHALISQWTLHRPIINSSEALYGGFGSEIVLKEEYLDRIFPRGTSDLRFEYWFDDPYCTLNPQSAMFLKFSAVSDPNTRDYDANYIFFRYAGLILLRAEALANLGQTAEAIELLNMVRNRAGVSNYSGSGGSNLVEAILLEREKELLGEGWTWYDLVRTGRVTNPSLTGNPLTQDEFNRKAWTWPIETDIIRRNPLVTQNDYWR